MREDSVENWVIWALTLVCVVWSVVSGALACCISAVTMLLKSMLLKPLNVMGEATDYSGRLLCNERSRIGGVVQGSEKPCRPRGSTGVLNSFRPPRSKSEA